jgi:hypothetical protein
LRKRNRPGPLKKFNRLMSSAVGVLEDPKSPSPGKGPRQEKKSPRSGRRGSTWRDSRGKGGCQREIHLSQSPQQRSPTSPLDH